MKNVELMSFRAVQLDEMNPTFQEFNLLSWTSYLLFACPWGCHGLRANRRNVTAR